ncbi:MAG: histidine phosphatase family protein [Gammaproteobacteria bacterium]|nr:histidine phosphatase family protein [Gammaproteobacteria bacterium]
MKSLYLVRHGQTRWNAEQRLQGRMDSPLTVLGESHAANNAGWLAGEQISSLVASPLGRTRTTARIVAQRIGVAARFDDRLMERHCGAWEGLTLTEVAARWPGEYSAWRADPFHCRPPGGENLPDMMARVSALLDALRASRHERTVIVSHGLIGRAMLTYLLSLDAAVANTVRQPNDLIYRLTFHAARVGCEHYRPGAGLTAGLFTPPA